MRRAGLVAVMLSVGCGPFEEKTYVEPKVTAISALNCTTCAVRDGSVWCWGANDYGQLGKDPSAPNDGTPWRVSPAGVRFRDVAVGTTHACAVTDDGRVYCWGGNAAGQAALVTFEEHFSVKKLTDLFDKRAPWNEVPILDDAGQAVPIEKVTAGILHTCALARDTGRVYCWGSNHAGQCGSATGKFATEPTEGACEWTESNLFTQLMSSPDAVVKLEPTPVPDLGKVKDVVAQRNTTCALTGGTVRCWGGNCADGSDDSVESALGNDCSHGGQLGLSPGELCYSWTPQVVGTPAAVRIGMGHVSGFAAIGGGKASTLAWGWDGGQLGGDSVNEPFSPHPVLLEDGKELIDVDAFGHTNGWHQFARTNNGRWYSWGRNHCGELGQKGAPTGAGATSARAAPATWIPQGSGVQLASGQDHTCFVADGAVRCFGHGHYVGGRVSGTLQRCEGETTGGDAVRCRNGEDTEAVLEPLEVVFPE